MSRALRLTSTADIRRTYAEGRKASSPAVVVHVLLSGDARPPRIGVSAARGIGNAVSRNRAKRRIREAVRTLGRPVASGADVMLIANRKALSLKFQELVDNVRSALTRAGGLVA